jgi:antitoxin VapB
MALEMGRRGLKALVGADAVGYADRTDRFSRTTRMIAIAKLYKTGRTQNVRLPDGFELVGDEVWIRKDEETGEVILSPKPPHDSLQAFFDLLDQTPLPDDFLSERQNPVGVDRNPLADWRE